MCVSSSFQGHEEKFNCAEAKREREKRRGENARHGRMKVSRRVTYLLSSPSVKYYEGDSVIGTARVSTIFERTY